MEMLIVILGGYVEKWREKDVGTRHRFSGDSQLLALYNENPSTRLEVYGHFSNGFEFVFYPIFSYTDYTSSPTVCYTLNLYSQNCSEKL